MKLFSLFLLSLFFLSSHAAAEGHLHVKVTRIQERDGIVDVLLPMHQTALITRAENKKSLGSLELNDFYDADIVPGEVRTTRKSRLRIKVSRGRTLDLLILKINFQSGR